MSLEKVWKLAGQKEKLKVRFCDWSHQIKYLMIVGESSDGKRILGILDNGEKMSYRKSQRGWFLYQPEDEIQQAHAV